MGDSGKKSATDLEEIVQLKEQIKCLQGKMREEENTKANESKHSKKMGKGEDPKAEEEP